jgi:uncharacterized membrane protein YfhO
MEKKYDVLAFIIPFSILMFIFLIYNVFLGMHLPGFHGDYYIQHVTLYNYIRESFYESGNLFPQMNMTHGGISSFANLVYYGSMNPIVWFSFLFPFMSMQTYLELVIVFFISTVSFLNYKFLKFHIENNLVNFLTSVAFSVVPVMIVQLQTQLPFVLFYPFLLICLITIHDFKNRYIYFIIAMSLIYYINFTFSVSVFIFMVIYYLYLHRNKLIESSNIVKFLIFFVIANALALMIGFLPFIIQALASNSRSVTEQPELYSTKNFIENMYVFQYLVFGYSWSLYLYMVVASFVVFFKKTRKLSIFLIFLALSIMFVPLNKLLNMFLYYDVKVYINFIPFVMLMFASVINELLSFKIGKRLLYFVIFNMVFLVIYAIYPQIVLFGEGFNQNLIIFIILQNIVIMMLLTNKNHLVNILTTMFIVFISFTVFSDFHVENRPTSSACQQTPTEFYRTAPLDSFNISSCSQEFMFTSYTSIVNENYANYATKNLNNPENAYAVSDRITSSELAKYVLSIGSGQPFIKGVESQYIYENNIDGFNNIDMVSHVESENYNIEYDKEIPHTSVEIEDMNVVPEVESTFDIAPYCVDNDYLEVEFSVDGAETFRVNNSPYVNDQEKYSLVFDCELIGHIGFSSQENMTISEITINGYNYDDILSTQYPSVMPTNVNVDYNESITFDLNMQTPGMLVTTIPYDDGFDVKVDGVSVDTEIVNHYFLGVPLESGNHTIEITFKMKGFYLGLIVTIIGILITIYLVIKQKKPSF